MSRSTPQPAGPAPAPWWLRPEALAVALGMAMLAAQAGWLAASQHLLEWDDAWYLEYALTFRRALLDHGLGALLAELRAAFRFKAPGVSLAAGLVMAVVGELPRAAVAVSLVAWFLGAAYLLLLARRFLSPGAAALAAVLAASMPTSFALGRVLLVEASLTLAVVAFLFHAAASEGLRRPGHVVALAAWGAVGLLVKVSYPAYVLVPALLLSVAPRPAGPRGWARWVATWGGVALAACGVAAWAWYADNWRAVLEYTRSVGGGAIAAQYAVPVPAYLLALVTHGLSPWNLVAGVALAVAAAVRPAGRVRWAVVGLALAWAVPPALLLGTSPTRYVRYLAPILPAFALMLAALADPWLGRSRRHALAVAALLALPPLAYFAVATIPTPLAGAVRSWVTAPWVGANLTSYEAPPDPRPWPDAAIVAAAARAAGGGPPVVLRLNVDLPELNHNNLKVEAVLQRVAVVPAQIDQGSPEGAVATALDGDLLLLQTGGPVAADFLNRQRAAVADELATGLHPYRELARFELPGGRQVALLERRCLADGGVAAGPPLATLEGGLELLSVDLARPGTSLLTVRTRYRATRGSHAALAVQVALARADGQLLGGQEHLLCRRPRAPWAAGAVIEDTFLLPAWAAGPGIELRLGLRDLRTGEPLRVDRAGAGAGLAGTTSIRIDGLAGRLAGSPAR